MKRPQNVSDVRRFLGMVNHLQKFADNLAEKTKLLRDLLSTTNQWYWGQAQEKTLCELKQDLRQAPVLAHYNPDRETTISCDASSFGLGAGILQTQDDGSKKPIAYASKALTSTEQFVTQQLYFSACSFNISHYSSSRASGELPAMLKVFNLTFLIC